MSQRFEEFKNTLEAERLTIEQALSMWEVLFDPHAAYSYDTELKLLAIETYVLKMCEGVDIGGRIYHQTTRRRWMWTGMLKEQPEEE